MPPKLIIFDCDGVLIDSEGIAARLIAANLTALGWPMTPAENQDLFLGMSILDMEPMIEAKIGRTLPAGWRRALADDLVKALGEEAVLIPGAREVLARCNALAIDWRVASNSSDEEMRVKFARTGLSDLTKGRTFAAMAVGRPKPAPDVYLAAARDAGVAPADCLVVEDSALGVKGAVAAGMAVFGFDAHGDGAHLRAAGAHAVLHWLDDLFEMMTRQAA
ncbi:MAG: haloacid dehalogenase [Acidocella sp. 20-57-95]|nr:MAG: haloacid dehalogenase [Acidocella sp. 20-57-95]OYV57957.1 MAG: haloacid dehalogenase [Acidocella sp. 21-58-7]HQT65324.1 HAD family phosphatase [Acidocella sp.]HQU05285.1 HAD family phosphatase [Acidocella sp.]